MNVNIAASVEATDGQMLGMMEHYILDDAYSITARNRFNHFNALLIPKSLTLSDSYVIRGVAACPLTDGDRFTRQSGGRSSH